MADFTTDPRLILPDNVKSALSQLEGSSRATCTMAQRQVLVYGGNGALGRAIVSAFAGAQWAVTSVDISENPTAARNVPVSASASWEEAATQVREGAPRARTF